MKYSHCHKVPVVALICLFVIPGTLSMVLSSTPVAAAPHTKGLAAATTADWPRYLHDLQNTSATTDTTISPANATKLVKRWSYKTGGIIGSSPTVLSGVVYVGSWDGYEYALNAATGALIWKTYLGYTTVNSYCNPPSGAGVSSAPTVLNGVVYLGGGDSYWYALDAATGNVLWKVFTGDNSASSGYYNWSSPLIYNGYAYIGIASFGDCPLVQGQLLKVDLTTHQIVNTFNVVPTGQIGGGIWTTPALDSSTNSIYITTGTESLSTQSYAQAFVELDATTLAVKDYWKLPQAVAVVDSDFGTSPTLFQDATGTPMVGATNKNGYFYAFKRDHLSSGPVWQALIAIGGDCPVPCGESTVSSASFGNGALYAAGEDTSINGVGYRGSIRAINPTTGAFLWQHGTVGPVVGAVAYSNGLIYDTAGSTFEVLDASNGNRLYSYKTGGLLYSSPSVAEGMVYTGSVDTNVYAFGLPTSASNPPPDANCPTNWTCQDIGKPTPTGSETVTNGTWTVKSSGTGIKGTSDQFRLLSQNVNGDLQISADLVSLQTSATTTQMGITVRQNNDPGSPNYSVFFNKGGKITVQYRSAFSGSTTTLYSSTTSSTLPLYLAIQRHGDQFQAAYSNDNTTYTLFPGVTTTFAMPYTVMAGLASSSGTTTTTTTTYDTVAASSALNTTFLMPSSASPCATGWSCQDIGNPLLVGDQSLNNGNWTLQGAGTDINKYVDQFHFVWQSWKNNIALSTGITSQTNTSPGAKAGLMLRQDTDSSAIYYAALATPGQGVSIQYRPYEGGNTIIRTTLTGQTYPYLMITRYGNTFSTYTSMDGSNWNYALGSSVTFNMSATFLAGLAVTSQATTTMGSATFNNTTSGANPPAPPLCPTGWQCADIGNATPTGEEYYNNNTWTVLAGGNDIWNTSDQFRYDWQVLAGDGSVSAHVISQTNSSDYAKAGVMLRQSSDPSDAYYALLVTPAHGLLVQYRTSYGANAVNGPALSGAVPTYVMVSRSGSMFSAFTSTDGTTWTYVAGSSISINITGSIQAGLATTSHNSYGLTQVQYDSVNVSTSPVLPPNACPITWNCADIGEAAPTGAQAQQNNAWTMYAGGGDIWNVSDQFRYVWQGLTGDGSVGTHVTMQTNSNAWAKAGVMLRQSTDANSAYYAILVTPANGIVVQYRLTAGGTAATLVSLSGSVPAYLLISRSGTTFSAFTSTDGTNWTFVPGSNIAISMSTGILVGLAATSHNVNALTTVNFDTVTVSTTPVAPPSTCPTSWNCADIGSTLPAGNENVQNGTWTINAGGSDIWNTADQFHYDWQTLAADGSVSAHVTSQINTDPWAKAGVMLRQTTDANSAYYAIFVTPSNGIVVQYRLTAGANARTAMTQAGTLPAYLLVSRSGNTFSAFTSTDGTTWNYLKGSSAAIGMTGTVLAGMAVTSHNVTAISTATFDTVSVSTSPQLPPSTCPTSWNCADIGGAIPSGDQSVQNGTWTISAGGSDIWGTTDQFHYDWQTLATDGSVSAHITSQTNTDPWAKAGVMLRQTADANSAYYAIFVTPGNGIVVQSRSLTGATAIEPAFIPGTTPAYVKVTRAGMTFTAYTSSDGVNWTLVPGSTTTIGMTGSVLEGLATTSHNVNTPSTVVYDTFSTS